MSTAQLKLVAVSGSPRSPSRTNVLVSAIANAIAGRLAVDVRELALGEVAGDVLPALTADALSAAGRKVIATIESADILVVGTPAYRGSFTGLLKSVFDLVHHEALRGRVAVLAATGGSALHGLLIEHQLRPLMSFFGVHTAPSAVYAVDSDFTNYRLSNPAIAQRIEQVAEEAARLTRVTGLARGPSPHDSSRFLKPAEA